MGTIRVLLVDDQEIIRQGLATILRYAAGTATRRISKELPNTQVIILTTYDTDNLVFEGIKAGARGYLLKDAAGETLVEAIRGVVRGQSQIDPKVARKVLSEFQRLAAEAPPGRGARSSQEDDLVIEPLTSREEDVLRLLVEGLSNKEIGATLSLTEGTIKNYVSTIIGKLQANDRTHAVVTALRRGLVEL